MSYLYRSGTGRNNIAFTTTANSSTRYLRRLGSGRTNINWYTIPQGSTYNILQRNGTGRNNILWSNLNIPKPAGSLETSSNLPSGDSAGDVTVYAYLGKESTYWYRIQYMLPLSWNSSDPRKRSGYIMAAYRERSTIMPVYFYGSNTSSTNMQYVQKISIDMSGIGVQYTIHVKYDGNTGSRRIDYEWIETKILTGQTDIASLYQTLADYIDNQSVKATIVFSSNW